MKRERNFKWFASLSGSLALVSCSNSPVSKKQLTADAIPPTALRSSTFVVGWQKVAELKPKFVVFGEIHGTNEAPLFFGKVASELALQGKRILVAVELSAIDNAQFQDAWSAPHSVFEERLTSNGWSGRRDGVTSFAMLKMLSQLHALKDRGADISLVAFNGFKDEAQRLKLDTPSSQDGHEAAQAENISEAASQRHFDYTLILVGQAHASKTELVHAGSKFQPMAMRLNRAGKVISLAMASSGGEAWTCTLKPNVRPTPQQPINSGMLDCGNSHMSGITTLGTTQHIALGQLSGKESDAEYDGYYWLGDVTGSSPARP